MREIAGLLLLVGLTGCGGGGEPAPAVEPAESTADPTAPTSTAASPDETVGTADEPEVADVAVDTSDPIDLLHAVPTTVRVSSAYRGELSQVAHLVDEDLTTAWNSATDDLVGAWIEVRIPADASVTSIALTSGFTRVRGSSDLFAGNHRVSRLRVRRDGEEVGVYPLETDSRELQQIPVEGPGGVYRLEVVAVQAGTRDDWRETCISELRVMGRSPGAEAGASSPEAAIGPSAETPAEEVAPEAPGAPAPAEQAALRTQLMEFLGEDEIGELHITSLGALGGDSPVGVYSVRAEESFGSSERLLLAVAVMEGDARVIFSFELGATSFEPGVDASDQLRGFRGLARDHGVVRAEFTVTSFYAEVDTCADCQGRREAATVQKRYVLVCAPGEYGQACSVTPIALEIVRASGIVDDNGRRGPNPDGEDPQPFALTLTIIDAEYVRLVRASGVVDAALLDRLGEITMADLHDIGATGDRLE